MSATAFNDMFPFQLPQQFFGTFHAEQVATYSWFQIISNELVTPKILVCSSDVRTTARSWDPNAPGGFRGNFNLSYFVGVDTGFELPSTILGGDGNLTGGTPLTGGPPGATYIDMPPAQAASFGWSAAVHNQQGNILQSDGSVVQYSNAGLPQALRGSGGQTNRVLLP
jgi:hypothetical protein